MKYKLILLIIIGLCLRNYIQREKAIENWEEDLTSVHWRQPNTTEWHLAYKKFKAPKWRKRRADRIHKKWLKTAKLRHEILVQ